MGRKGKAVEFRHTVLSNGLELVAECNAHAQSVAVGFLVGAGSRDETDEISGVSHFLEHMVFKGSSCHGAGEFDRKIEALGGSSNAATGFDDVHFYVLIPPKVVAPALELLLELVLKPALLPEAFIL